MSGGRPTDYRPEYCERVLTLGRDGKSHAQIAADLGVSRQTLHNWAAAHAEFAEAIAWSRDLAQAWFENKGQDGLGDNRFNAALWSKQMAARFRSEYCERTVLAGDPDAPLKGLSDDDLDAKIAAAGADWAARNGWKPDDHR